MTDTPESVSPFWQRYDPDNPRHAGVLAALRQGSARAPGDVPAMWSCYTTLTRGGGLSKRLWAEHLALSMFGWHQQGVRVRVHRRGEGRPGRSVPEALGVLRSQSTFSPEALDARVAQAVNSVDARALAYHLRGLADMLKSLNQPQIDYDLVFRDFLQWQRPERRAEVRLRWAMDYAGRRPTDDQPNTSTDSHPKENQ